MNHFIKKNWEKWIPDKLCQNNKNVTSNNSLKYKMKYISNTIEDNSLNKKILKNYEKGYQSGFQDGYKQGWFQGFNSISKKYIKNYEKYLEIKLINILKKFESSIDALDNHLEHLMFKMVVKISKQAVSDALEVNQELVLYKIKNILNYTKRIFCNPRLYINSKKKAIIEKKFGTLLTIYNWKIFIDNNIDIHSCYIITDEGEIDAKMETYWKNLEKEILIQRKKYEI